MLHAHCCSTLVALSAVLLAQAPHACAQAPESARETTYQEAGANWKPIPLACTVLSSKNGPFKFVTTFRGGISTAYVSEVLGDSPLIPPRAPLMARLDESVQVLFATGQPLDYRRWQTPEIRQRLLKGYLPIMVTTWRDVDNGLDYEEHVLTRNLDGGYEGKTGNESGVALMRLRVRNLTSEPRTAYVTLCVNRSPNGQQRGVAAYPYASILKAEGNSAVGPDGKVRLIWQAPAGVKGVARFRKAIPQIVEWDGSSLAGAVHPAAIPEEPFNRFLETGGKENHGPHKAFDILPMNWWEPARFPAANGGDVGIGLRFPEDRWLRGLRILYRGGGAPLIEGGYRLEVFDGSKWVAQPHRINGHETGALAGHPELQQQIGGYWVVDTAPARCRGFRLIFEKMPEGSSKPMVAEISHVYSEDTGSGAPLEETVETGGYDYRGNTVSFEIPLPAHGTEEVVAAVPFLAASAREIRSLRRIVFERELASAEAYWEGELARGMQICIPEATIKEIWNVNVPHMYTTAMMDPTLGQVITPTNIGWYEAIWPSLSAAEMIGLDQRGLHAEARAFMEPFLRWQGQSEPVGEYNSREGFFTSPNAYTWVRWTSNHGWILWAISEHYLLTDDAGWIARVTPNILAGCDWVERERARTKNTNDKGERVPEWGLLPPGKTGDGSPACHNFFNEAVTWRGMDAAATALQRSGHARAARIRAAADEYKECIQRSMHEAVNYAPPYKLASGEEVPLVSIDLYNVWKINTGTPAFDRHPWWLDVGPLHAVDLGALDGNTELAGWMAKVAEDHFLKHGVAIDEPFYCPQRGLYIDRDDMPRFVEFFYNLAAEGMDRQTYAPVEGHHGVQNLPWADGEFSRTLRRMLVDERGTTLRIAQAIPRLWMAQGQRISVKKAPTRFGEISFEMTSAVLDRNLISAVLMTPSRHPADKIEVRFRHPEGKPIKRVTVAGSEWTDYEGEWVRLPGSPAGQYAVDAHYE